jgi:hypothetical protein
MPNKKMKYCYCSLECKERRRLLSYRQRLRHYKKAKLANISPCVSPTESSVESQAMDLESEIEVDVSMGEPHEGLSPEHSESEEDTVSNHADENALLYDEEEENNDVDE